MSNMDHVNKLFKKMKLTEEQMQILIDDMKARGELESESDGDESGEGDSNEGEADEVVSEGDEDASEEDYVEEAPKKTKKKGAKTHSGAERKDQKDHKDSESDEEEDS